MARLIPFLIAIGLSALLILNEADADSWRLVEAKSVDLGYRSYFPGSRDPLVTQNGLPDRQLGKGFDLDLRNDLFWSIMYFDATVHATTDEDTKNGGGQFRSCGLQFRTGFNVTDYLQLGYFHHSQHVIDTTYKPGFPVEDALEVRLNLYRAKP